MVDDCLFQYLLRGVVALAYLGAGRVQQVILYALMGMMVFLLAQTQVLNLPRIQVLGEAQ